MNERIKSAAAFEEAKQIIPGGVNSPVRALKSVGTTPLFVRDAKGPYIYDIDDNKFIDFCMSWGVFILGHNNDKVSKAASDAIFHGSSFGIPTLAETTLAEKVRESFPSMERLRFVNSGTEATMSAIRVARGFTGRDILVKFEGCYHGHADHLLVSAGSAVAKLNNASSAGVPAGFTQYTVVLPYNDTEALEKYFAENGDKVAARVNELEKIPAIELNISCPNVKDGGMAFGVTCEGAASVVKAVRKVYDKTLIVKLSPNVTSIADIARAVEAEGADSVSLINTLMGMAVDIEKRQPLLSIRTGGLSGPCVKPVALRMVYDVAHAVNIPVVGLGGISNAKDAIEFLMCGATAIEIGTANFLDPAVTKKVKDGMNEWLDAHGCKSVTEIIGAIK